MRAELLSLQNASSQHCRPHSTADVWGGGEAEAVVPCLFISHLLYSQILWQDRFDLDQAQTHFCWISSSTWYDLLQFYVSWPRYVSSKMIGNTGLGIKVARLKLCHQNSWMHLNQLMDLYQIRTLHHRDQALLIHMLGTLNPDASACESRL